MPSAPRHGGGTSLFDIRQVDGVILGGGYAGGHLFMSARRRGVSRCGGRR